MQARAKTDIGKMRAANQDAVFYSTDPVGAFPNLFLLADGTGGHKGGAYASKFLLECMTGFISRNKSEDIPRVLRNAINFSNTMLHQKSHSDPALSGMCSTLVAAVISGSTLHVANIGDSRLYLIRNGISQITLDHSQSEEMVRRGETHRGSEIYLKNKPILTKAVGFEERVTADFFEEELKKGDHLLLCSDGLTNMLDDDRILSVVTGNGGLDYRTGRLIDEANENGGRDNIAVILVKYEEDNDHA